MTQKISTIYDALVTKCDTLFPSKQRLHNPYELTDNPELIQKDGYGIRVLSAEKVDMEFCNLSLAREFSLILIRQFASVGSKEDAFDTISKAILEDQQTFLNNIYSPTELSIGSTIDQIEIVAIDGINFKQADQKKFLTSETRFRITASEALI